jgi:hypothetical protein
MPGRMLINTDEVSLALDTQVVLRWRCLFPRFSRLSGLPWQAANNRNRQGQSRDTECEPLKLRARCGVARWIPASFCHTRESGYPVRRSSSINHRRLWNTGSPAFADDDSGMRRISNSRLHSRDADSARVMHDSSARKRAQGMPGARRARSLACKIKKHTSVVTTVTPE